MSPRAHFGLRLSGLILLVALAAWPRTRESGHDPPVVPVANAAHPAAKKAAVRHTGRTLAARVDRAPRPRAGQPAATTEELLPGAEMDPGALTN